VTYHLKKFKIKFENRKNSNSQSTIARICKVLAENLSVTLVDQDHIHVGWKSWKLIAVIISLNTYALRSPKTIHLIRGEHGETLRKL